MADAGRRGHRRNLYGWWRRLAKRGLPLAYLSRLSLTNFRNFRQVDLELPAGVSVFYGANAQGKTALLEAAYTLAVGRSFRAERERQVVNLNAARNGQAAYITGAAERDQQTFTVVVGYQPAAVETARPPDDDGSPTVMPSVSKQIRVNRQPSTAAGLLGRVGAVLFVVDDLNLVLGSPSHRRRYLDVLISQSHRPYLDALQRYQAALRNRNGLLRRQRVAPVASDEMEYWDAQLVQAGATLIGERADAIARLVDLAGNHYLELAELDQAITIVYRPSVPLEASSADTEALFRQMLQRNAARERATAVTAVGPHRDDFAIFADGLDAHAFASRGEARTIALSLRLAESDYLAQARGDDPIIMLDDVFSEMDAQRRERVLHKAAACRQALITTTDPEAVRAVLGNGAAYFHVSNGVVSPPES